MHNDKRHTVAEAQTGDSVKVHYTGRLEDGTVFDSSEGREPLGFTLGSGQVIPGFEEAVVGLEPGGSRTTTIPPEEAYGTVRDDLIIEVERSQVPPDLDPEVGQQLQLTLADGQAVPVVITKVGDEALTLDANHPLAGKTLVFDIELVEVG